MYAVVNRYKDNQGVMTVNRVFYGLPSKAQAHEWNQITFASPEWNLVVSASHVSELDE